MRERAAEASRAFARASRRQLIRLTVFVVVIAVAFVGFSMWAASQREAQEGYEGLPVYITSDMVAAAQAMQHEYGHPAGCTIAQIIQESGQGNGLSALAERDNNLFGMKWSSSYEGKQGVVGPVTWDTNEEYDGQTVTVAGTFIAFESKVACIEFRSSVFLQASRYADNPTIQRAIETADSALMAYGLQSAGWATDSSYAEHLIALMDQYDLYRFDAQVE